MGELTIISSIGRLFTAGAAGVVENAAVVIRDGTISFAGPEALLAEHLVGIRSDGTEVDLKGALVTPGLIDAHSHPVYAGNRFAEIAQRSAGASYSQIAASGGGIAATVAATRAASSDSLASAARHRLRSWLDGGTTTVEAKTGYHLDGPGEIEAVRILAGLAGEPDLPSIEVTWLAGHGIGPEYGDDGDGYIDEACRWCADARSAGARHADVFCDEGYFTVEQSRRLLTAASSAGMLPRIHADELARTGGARLAAELGCSSADHLLRVEATDARLLADAGVVATLAPVTALAMGKRPPVRALLEAGVTIALGSDHNPGTCGTTSMSLVVALAVAELGLSVHQALEAATAGGAASLHLADRGRIVAGSRADIVAWDADHEGAFSWNYGLRPLRIWKA